MDTLNHDRNRAAKPEPEEDPADVRSLEEEHFQDGWTEEQRVTGRAMGRKLQALYDRLIADDPGAG